MNKRKIMSGTYQGRSATSATPTTIVERDSNANTAINAIVENTATVVSAAGTTTLTVSSAPIQILTGTQTETFVLPDATTLVENQAYKFINNSTGNITLQTSDAASLITINASSVVDVFCTSIANAVGVWAITPVASGGGAALATTADIWVSPPSATTALSPSLSQAPYSYDTGTTYQTTPWGLFSNIFVASITPNFNGAMNGILVVCVYFYGDTPVQFEATYSISGDYNGSLYSANLINVNTNISGIQTYSSALNSTDPLATGNNFISKFPINFYTTSGGSQPLLIGMQNNAGISGSTGYRLSSTFYGAGNFTNEGTPYIGGSNYPYPVTGQGNGVNFLTNNYTQLPLVNPLTRTGSTGAAPVGGTSINNILSGTYYGPIYAFTCYLLIIMDDGTSMRQVQFNVLTNQSNGPLPLSSSTLCDQTIGTVPVVLSIDAVSGYAVGWQITLTTSNGDPGYSYTLVYTPYLWQYA